MNTISTNVVFGGVEELLAEFASHPDNSGYIRATRIVTRHSGHLTRQVYVVATALVGNAIFRFESHCGDIKNTPLDIFVGEVADLKIRQIKTLGQRLGIEVRAGLWEHAQPS